MYEYQAQIIRVVDGDTVHADVDLGIDVHINLTLRLVGIDAPEISTIEGAHAADWLRERLGQAVQGPEGPIVTIRTEKDRREKYGRYLATLYIEGVSVNDQMVAAGQAVAYKGGKR